MMRKSTITTSIIITIWPTSIISMIREMHNLLSGMMLKKMMMMMIIIIIIII